MEAEALCSTTSPHPPTPNLHELNALDFLQEIGGKSTG